MPRKKRSTKQNPNTYKLINVDFNDAQRVEINLWTESATHTIDALSLEIIDAGFKFSLSRDEYHECYVISLTHKSISDPEKPVYMLRHSDFEKLIRVSAYFFTVMLDRGDANYSEATDTYDW